jgi:HPt (histidine-containing phosphotransfer) domain-containing protein
VTKRPSKTGPSPASTEVVFDQRLALSYTGGDRRLLKEVITLFRSDLPSYVRRIGSALKRRDGEALRMTAHGLKGALATVGSERGREIARELEQLGATGRFDGGDHKYVRLREHLKLLDEAFVASGLVGPASRGRARPPAKSRKTSRKRGRK